LEYYFEVWDNDGVRGAKSSRSKTMLFKAPSDKELRNEMDKAGKSLKDDMKEAMRESKQLQKELKDLQLKMLEKRELTWEEKKKAQDLLNRQKELVKKIEDIKKQNEQNNLKENEYKEPNPELLEKQKQLEKMFNELMNDELKKLMKDKIKN
jgi:chromosome segregation ATPase